VNHLNRSQQFARFAHFGLVAPEACEAHGGAEFKGFGLLLACDSMDTTNAVEDDPLAIRAGS
jgi:hypothetical protein